MTDFHTGIAIGYLTGSTVFLCFFLLFAWL
jgi:hypothetical protein